jgi:multidrug resistance protein, MATE family
MGQSVVEVMLAGHANAHILGAVAVGSNIWLLGLMAAMGVMMAVPPSVARLHAAGRPAALGVVFASALWLALAVGVLLAAALWFAAGPLVRLVGAAPSLRADVVGFVHAALPGLPAVAMYSACRGLSDGMSLPRVGLGFGLLGLLLLGPVGYLFLFPLGLGARGSGLAACLVNWAVLAAYLGWISATPRLHAPGWRQLLRPDLGAMAALLRVGLPMAVTALAEMGMFSAVALAISRFGEIESAGHQVALNVAALSFMVPLGLAMAITVRVGNAIGRVDPAGVRRAGLVGIGLALATQAAASCVLLSVPRLIASLYTTDAAVIAGASVLLQLAGIFQLSDGVQVAANGALRGLQDTRLPMLLTGIAYWGIGLPLGLYLAFERDLRVPGMWIGLIAGLTAAALLLSLRFLMLTRPAACLPLPADR